MHRTRYTIRASLSLTLLLLALAGCGSDSTTVPADETFVVAEDPLDDVLKSLDGDTPAEPQGRIDRLAEVLGLDEDQIAALTVAYETFRAGVADLRAQVEDGSLTREEAREAGALLREAFEAELQLILTAEQWDLLQEMRIGAHGPHGNHHGHQTPYDRWNDWLAEIGADEDQVDAVFAALDVMRDGLRDLRDQVRAGELTHEEARDAAEVLRTDFDAELQEILTAEQYEALLSLRPDCGGRH